MLNHKDTQPNPKCQPKVFIKTFGWPLVTVARDGAGCAKEGKWFGIK